MLEVVLPGLELRGKEEQDLFHGLQIRILMELGEEHGILAEVVAVKPKEAHQWVVLAPRYKEEVALQIRITHNPINYFLEEVVEDISEVVEAVIPIAFRQVEVAAPVILVAS